MAYRTSKSRAVDQKGDGPAILDPVRGWPGEACPPDTQSLAFVQECRRQARAVLTGDPAGDEIMHFLAGVYDWPEA